MRKTEADNAGGNQPDAQKPLGGARLAEEDHPAGRGLPMPLQTGRRFDRKSQNKLQNGRMRKAAANLCGIASLAASLAYWVAAYFPPGSSGHLRVLSIFGPDAALKIGLAMAGAAVLGIIAGIIGLRVWLLAGAWALTSLAIGPTFKV